jgi:hypothetical protein
VDDTSARRIVHFRRVCGLREDYAKRLPSIKLTCISQNFRNAAIGFIESAKQNVQQFDPMIPGDIRKQAGMRDIRVRHAGTDGGSNPASGNSLVEAESLQDTLGIAGKCPILADGGSIEVAETFEM